MGVLAALALAARGDGVVIGSLIPSPGPGEGVVIGGGGGGVEVDPVFATGGVTRVEWGNTNAGFQTQIDGTVRYTDEVWVNAGSVTQTIANGSYVALTMGTEELDANDCWANSNLVFSGTGAFTIVAQCAMTLAADKPSFMALLKNGTRMRLGAGETPAANGQVRLQSVWREVNEAATNVWQVAILNGDVTSRFTEPGSGIAVWMRARRELP
jgi:hypothetical protein